MRSMGQVPGELAGWAASGGDFGREEPLGIGDGLLRAMILLLFMKMELAIF